jgi:hypothetical protein
MHNSELQPSISAHEAHWLRNTTLALATTAMLWLGSAEAAQAQEQPTSDSTEQSSDATMPSETITTWSVPEGDPSIPAEIVPNNPDTDVVVNSDTAAEAPKRLARTGLNLGKLVALGGSLIGVGALSRKAGQKREHSLR